MLDNAINLVEHQPVPPFVRGGEGDFTLSHDRSSPSDKRRSNKFDRPRSTFLAPSSSFDGRPVDGRLLARLVSSPIWPDRYVYRKPWLEHRGEMHREVCPTLRMHAILIRVRKFGLLGTCSPICTGGKVSPIGNMEPLFDAVDGCGMHRLEIEIQHCAKIHIFVED